MAEKLWVEQFVRELDRDERKKILEKAVAEEGMDPANELRTKILEARYLEKNGMDIDVFIRGWMEMSFISNISKGSFGKKQVKKELDAVRKDWQFAEAAAYGETGAEVLYQELCNMVRLFVQLCQKDRAYGSVIFGLGHMKEKSLIGKIARDIYRVAFQIPRDAGVEEEFEPLSRAASEVYCEIFDKQKDLLLDKVRNRE